MSTISIWSARRDHLVGDRLPLLDAADPLHHVVERLQVLDVDRGDHVDAGVEQLVDVLPALLVPAAGDVGVRELVDQRHRRAAGPARRRGPSPRTWCRGRSSCLRGHDLEALRAAPRCGRGRASRPRRRRRRSRGRAGACPRRAWRTSCPPRAPCRGRHADVRGSRGHCPASRASARLSSSTFTRGSPRKPRIRPWVCVVDQLLDVGDAHPPGLRDAGDLEVGVRRADVGVEPGAAGGHGVRRHGASGRRRPAAAIGARAFCTDLQQVGRVRAEVGTARGERVVRRRRTGASGTTARP